MNVELNSPSPRKPKLPTELIPDELTTLLVSYLPPTLRRSRGPIPHPSSSARTFSDPAVRSMWTLTRVACASSELWSNSERTEG